MLDPSAIAEIGRNTCTIGLLVNITRKQRIENVYPENMS